MYDIMENFRFHRGCSVFQSFLDFFDVHDVFFRKGDPYKLFLRELSGKQFGQGLFTVFKEKDIKEWQKNIAYAFPAYKNKTALFGYDWLGRCFGVSEDKKDKGKVLLFEIGTGQVLSTDCSFEEFINHEIPLNSDACLASQFHEQWLGAAEKPLVYGRCVGYKVPLFLGGKDDISNLEDSDMDVYWSILSQILRQI